jgi:hypothetical protein
MAVDVNRSYGYTISVTIRKEPFGPNMLVTVSQIQTYMQSVLPSIITDVTSIITAAGFSVTIDGEVSVGFSSRTNKDDATMYLLVQGMGFGAIRARDSLQASILTQIAAVGGNWAGGTALDPLGVFTRGDARGLTDQSVSGKGDPHLVNMNGQRFDIFQEGRHVLIVVPRHAQQKGASLHVEADAKHVGGPCADLYFRTMTISGSWLGRNRTVTHHAGASNVTAGWKQYGPVSLKVVHGSTSGGVQYLNILAKGLNTASFTVGGLLGDGDHTFASTPPANCKRAASALQLPPTA